MAHWRPVDLEVKQRGRVRGGGGGDYSFILS